MDEDEFDLDAVEDVLDDYYSEDDAMPEADDILWDEDSEMDDDLLDDDDDYGEDDDSAERRSRRYKRRRAARRRARARALARARSRRARRSRSRRRPSRRRPKRRYMSPRRTPGKANASQVRKGFNRVSDDVAKTKAKIAKVDLEAKVKADALKDAFIKQSSRIGGNEYAISATKVIDEISQQFPQIKEDKILKSIVPLIPLAFLKPPKKGTGIESLTKDPRVIGAAIAGAIALYKGLNPEDEQEPTSMRVGPAPTVVLRNTNGVNLVAQILDQNGKPIANELVTWAAIDGTVVNVDAATGRTTAIVNDGTTTVVASSVKNPTITGGVNINVSTPV